MWKGGKGRDKGREGRDEGSGHGEAAARDVRAVETCAEAAWAFGGGRGLGDGAKQAMAGLRGRGVEAGGGGGEGCAVVWAGGVGRRDVVVGEGVGGGTSGGEGGGARVAVVSVASAREAVAEVLSAVRREAVGAAAPRRTRRRRPVRR